MKLINNNYFVNLEDYLDISALSGIEDNISFMLAKHSESMRTSSTPQNTLYNRNHIMITDKIQDYKNYQELSDFTDGQLEWYAKLNSAVTLGKHLSIKANVGYPSTYRYKHLSKFVTSLPWTADFSFLLDWIDAQKCFKDYGRVIFWINEPNQKTAFHRDYPDNNLNMRDSFIWLTGTNKKRLLLKDPITGTEHSTNCRALTFDSTNPHCSQGNEFFTSWSLRIDGVFDKNWATRAGIAEHFELS